MKQFKTTKFYRMFAAFLSIIMLSCTPTSMVEAKEAFPLRTEYTSANELCEICWLSYNKGAYGPIIVVQGQLQNWFIKKDVYLITLCGTELLDGQSTGILEDLLVGFQQENNAYTQNVVNMIKNTIPEGSNLFFTGHSLGGMVCQQVAANTYVKDNYNVLNTVTFGSPVISGGQREGVVRRLGDTSDFVPYLSVTGQFVRQIAGLNREDGGYSADGWSFSAGWKAHNNSYIREDLWGDYDVTGKKGGHAKLTLDLSTLRFEQAPSWF